MPCPKITSSSGFSQETSTTNDNAAATKPTRCNIGALPKHLPRCEQVLEPDASACPCCDGRLHKLLIPEQAAHRFRDDAAHPFRLIAARRSD
jgi:transposase